jgi:lipopolysaccharide biosynthesis glycosyltransferase
VATDCAVCYVADINFLYPTLLSAISLRKYVPAHKADAFIFLVDAAERVDELNKVAKPYGIEIVGSNTAYLDHFDVAKFNRTQVSTTTLSKFSLGTWLPSAYNRIVYIDGDTLVRRDPSALVEAVVPEGKLAAAEDMISFRYNKFTPRGRKKMSYLAGIGVDPPKMGYLNAGVFAVSRKTWSAIATEAFEFFVNNVEACEYHDQSALNAVVGDRRLRLSLKWNFQTPFRYLGIEEDVAPSIYHFHSYPKPWMGRCEPWPEIYEQYELASKPLAALALPVRKLDDAEVAEHNQLNWRKVALMKHPLISTLAQMHLGIKSYERDAWL